MRGTANRAPPTGLAPIGTRGIARNDEMIRVKLGYETQMQEDMEIEFDEEDFEFEEDEIFPPRSYTAYVRLMQADTFFGSRVTRAAADLSEGGI